MDAKVSIEPINKSFQNNVTIVCIAHTEYNMKHQILSETVSIYDDGQ